MWWSLVKYDTEKPRGLTASRGPRPAPAARARRALATLLAASSLAGCGYSEIHALDERAQEARSDIEIQLLRRAELAPTLIETVGRYVALESSLVDAVADSRVGLVTAVRSTDLSAMESADIALSAAFSDLLVAVDGAADLQADPGLQRLLVQLEDTQLQVALAGRRYNVAVELYNEYIAGFPQILTAKVMGADPRPPFATSEPADTALPADG